VRRQRYKRNKLKVDNAHVTDMDRKRRLRICLVILDVYKRMEEGLADPSWEGRAHPYIEYYGLPSYIIDFKLKIKAHQNDIAKQMVALQAELGINIDDDDEEFDDE
jgi:hypothetical protein